MPRRIDQAQGDAATRSPGPDFRLEITQPAARLSDKAAW
jgi:hypothetical protein